MKFETYNYWDYSLNKPLSIDTSKTFKNELIKQVSIQLKQLLGEIFDPEDFLIIFKDFPQIIENTSKTTVYQFRLSYYTHYATDVTLHWENLKGDNPINCAEEIEKDSIRIWIEDFNVEYLKRNLIKYAYLKRKVFLDGYRFVVVVKKPDIDISMKIIFDKNLSAEQADSLEHFIGKSISNYNENNQQGIAGFEGLIHSFSLKEFKNKDYAIFQIDLGSTADIGMKKIIQDLSDSSLNIKKIEIKGV
ncbi:hypothetical protein [Arcicella rosea]|uniref:Uncharacterized protein n=1 Tax=Arcicella rosea TaxID=502909 RepID=A0A841ELR4_9BACT|nr:hypothetical protein [Arcicella rosea]MBB6004592.1 hypothetical protein [Arcicella rosea]